ncbi:MAG: family 10 glycosylhydrolase, partial [Clostridium sp.]|nr:family 10 glycosylhydrolase [Clostridium sp.]
MNPTYQVMNQEATVFIQGSDELSGLAYARFIKGSLSDATSKKWDTKAKKVQGIKQFTVNSEGNYSILLVDKAGNRTVKKISIMLELRGTWISYLEFSSAGVSNMTKSEFQSYINETFDKCLDMHQNTVIVQVRPSGDALYPSKYFPWSSYVSGKQGKNPGYNPLSYMIEAAHQRNLHFYAWVNPYRVSAVSTSISSLSNDNQAKKWRNSSDKATKRNVLTYANQLYYNPAKSDVQTLIVNGIKEIVKNYKVDGVVFDDYFYPNLGSSYKTNFDYTEYKNYVTSCKSKGKKEKSIVSWRRENVNSLLKKVKRAVKEINSQVEFGVSPQGNIANLQSSYSCYCDISTWINSKDYIDFICPQIYWSTTNPAAPYEKVLNEWLDLRKKEYTKMYVAIAVYKAGMSKKEANALSPADIRWHNSTKNLMEQVKIGRDTGCVDGFMFYRYDNMISIKASKEMKNLLSIL